MPSRCVQVQALGPIPVKGLTELVEVCELVGASALRRRLQAAAALGLTRFVGRTAEMEALRHAMERASGSHGRRHPPKPMVRSVAPSGPQVPGR